MYHFTRRQILAAAGAAAAATVAGCSSDDPDSDSSSLDSNRVGAMDAYAVGNQFKAAEPLTFSIMMLSNPGYPYKADWPFWAELSKRTNVTLQPTVVPLSDYNQKRSVVVGAGDAPMIIPKTYHPDEEAYIAGGAIIPVSDYVDLMPNYSAQVKQWNLQGNLEAISQQDGKYYLLSGLHENVWQDYSLAMRTDILEKLGLAVPTTWDELTTVLRAMRQAYPDRYPFSDRWSTPPNPGANNLVGLLGAAYGTYAGWAYQSAFWDAAAGKFVFSAAMDQYKQVLQYLNTLVAEKLLDPESFTQTDDNARQKFANGKSFVISCNAQTLVNECRKDIAKIPGATVVKIPLPTGPMGPSLEGLSRLENGIMISRKARESKNFVAMMQFIDWLWYSDAGKMFTKWGIEGQTYNGSVADDSFKLAPDVKWAGINPTAPRDLQVDYGYSNGVFAYAGSTKLLNSQFSDEEKAFQAEMNKRQIRPVPPPHPFSPEEREQASLWETGLKDHVNQQSVKFILGQRPFSEWDAYLAELKGKNMDQYIDLANKAYDRFKKSNP
ncbi:ABC transporter substrate-binding protein [Actinoplanes derwentensis]|uniref:Carbohydrate ABC transporter substrate-binding protein, CUT1 family n=1 Tax=Actinoplanes derwentensis TaxID=113562 RepID=A0A1H1XFY6_9ACTN|nr:extracellular solute-binding protein [Actinoplanes derwentensis]GID87172.1 sugar ABC transporter substrate-binding protein [Actinoplanes derwentensis]SDT08185.1 carbohydrate ABC transporter substrate-binding protein, CUT1 family [Actinoplanes derwentensis]